MSILQPCMLIDRVSTTGYPWGGVWLGHDFTHRCEFAHTEPLRLAESNGQVKHRGGLAQWASHMVADRPTRHAPGATRPFGRPNERMHPNAPSRNSTASCTVGTDMLTTCWATAQLFTFFFLHVPPLFKSCTYVFLIYVHDENTIEPHLGR